MSFKPRVFIYGSCVTRDILRLHGDSFQLADYFARSSIPSVVSKPVKVNEEEINLDSQFQRRMIIYDYRKTLFNRLAQRDFDFLLIDFIDERFDLIQFWDKSLVTKSSELIFSGLLSPNLFRKWRYKEISRLNMHFDKWAKACEIFVERVKEIVPEENVLIVGGFWARNYLAKSGNMVAFEEREEIDSHNALLMKYYQYINKAFGGDQLLVSDEHPFADEMHVWGLSPFHYTLTWYDEMKDMLLKRMNNYLAIAPEEKWNADVRMVYVNSAEMEQLAVDTYQFSISAESKISLEYAWYVMKGNEIISKVPYAEASVFELQLEDPGIYQVLYFVRNEFGEVEKGSFERFAHQAEINVQELRVERMGERNYHFSVDAECNLPLLYAWYVMKDNVPIEKNWYSKSPIFKYEFPETGSFQIEYFIRNEFGDTISGRFETINI